MSSNHHVDVDSSSSSGRKTQRITWDDLDPVKYYTYNLLFGFLVDSSMYPIDVVRTRLQVQGFVNTNQTFTKINGTFDGLKSIYRYEGLRGYYKGFATGEFGYLSSKIVYFSCYEKLKQYLFNSNFGQASAYISGGLAELSSLAIWVPFDVTTQKIQIQGHMTHNLTPIEMFKKTYSERGIRGLYRGFGATIMRNVPYSAIWWGSYEQTKDKLTKYDIRSMLGLPQRDTSKFLSVHDTTTTATATTSSSSSSSMMFDEDSHMVENEDPLVHMLAGFISAIISTTLTNPLDVAKTRLQTGNYTPLLEQNSTSWFKNSVFYKHSHFVQVISNTIKVEGFRALWKGIIPSLITSAPYSMISIIVYEEVKKLSLKQ